jgi:hypothetical protein
MKSSPWRRGFTVSLAIGMVLACGDIRQDEFICENAVSHLQEGCPGFDPTQIVCSYDTGCGVTTFPEIDATQGQCILGDSCQALVANGVCDRVAALPDEGLDEAGTSPPVCAAVPAPVGTPVGTQVAPEAGVGTEECLSATDCAAGDVCCAVFTLAMASLVCAPQPCESGLQSCATSVECPAGEACELLGGAVASFCTSLDASPGTPIDSSVDDASSSTPDAPVAQSVPDAGSAPDGRVADASADAGADGGGP